MNVLLISRINTDNLGDIAIHMSMEKLVSIFNCNIYSADLYNTKKNNNLSLKNKKSDKKKEYLFFNKIKKTKLYNYIYFLKHNNIYDILNEKKNFDYVFIGGGELIASSHNFCYSIYNWVRKIKKKNKNTKIYLYSVGVNNNLTNNELMYLKRIMNDIEEVYVRDENSKYNFKDYFGFFPKEIPDCVFINDSSFQNEKNRNIILYGLTDFSRIHRHNRIYTSKNDYYEQSYKKIKELQEKYKNKTVELYYTTQSDINECIEFADYVHKKYGENISLSDYKNLDELKLKFNHVYFCSSPRMHGCILAKVYNVPYVEPIIISNKMNAYFEKYGKSPKLDLLKNELYQSMSSILKDKDD